jgi:hypothetical protein
VFASRRSRFDLRAGFQRGHDPFGTNRTEDATVRSTDLDIWHNVTGGATFHYGAPEARLNAEIGFSGLARDYQTNKSSTRFLNYNSTSAQYTLFYNYSPKTSGLVDFVRTGIKVDESFGPVDDRSGQEYRFRTGMRWLASGKTSGDVRVGYFVRTFDNTSFSDEGFDWQAGIQWAPRERTVIALETARASQESYRADTFVNITRSGNLRWAQNWTAKTNTTLRVGETTTAFIGAGRNDRLYNAGLEVNQAFTRYVSLVLGLDVFNRQSNDPSAEFDRFTSYLGIRLGR